MLDGVLTTSGQAALTSEAVAPMSEEDTWRARGRQLRAAYCSAQPWPHIVIHDIFSPVAIEAAEAEELPTALALVPHRSHLEVKGESPSVAGPSAALLLDAMCTPAFVAFVEEITGVKELVADPSHVWSGLNASGPGSFQSMHRDFAHHPVTGQWHRVNVLLYLNSSWPEEYGGDLELWPPDMTACGARIRPIAGTMVVFETNYGTLHGVPDPIRCPPERSRLSLTSYYYSDGPQPGKAGEPIFRRPRRPQDPWRMGIAELRHIALGLAQPIYRRIPVVQRAVDSLRRGVKRA
jgi:Rps23 Pro-64 3,4-dihydroxylase Tpa1-like proline 4-hydroxylase